jgi:hypothetical protein
MEVGRFDAIRTGRLARGENGDGIAVLCLEHVRRCLLGDRKYGCNIVEAGEGRSRHNRMEGGEGW